VTAVAPPVVLVMAKAPTPGTCKTRLIPALDAHQAAQLAAGLLLDTLAVAAVAATRLGFAPPTVALAGDPEAGVRPGEVLEALGRCRVIRQCGADFAERLAAAHQEAAGAGPVVQIGTDAPELGEAHLLAAADALTRDGAVLGPSRDGGWWLLGLRNGRDATALRRVPMSTADTGAATRAALEARGLRVALPDVLHDLDTPEDLVELAARLPAAGFAR